MIKRRWTRTIKVGNITIGGGAPVSIQEMTSTPTEDVKETVAQIKSLERAGCELVRVAVPNKEAAKALKEIKSNIDIPLIADIHFDYRLAIMAAESGVDKLRINPGNIGDREKVAEVAKAAKKYEIPIRIGVNSGSIQKEIYEKYGGATPEAMVESALFEIELLEDFGFKDIVVSLKSSDVKTTVKAYQLLADKVDYPFHIGITEAGYGRAGIVKSAVGIGILLFHGLGDTVRVSLTSRNPVGSIKVARSILTELGY